MLRGGLARWGTVGLLCLVPPACTDDPQPFEGTLLRSQYWEYHDHVSEPICPTLLAMLDQHTQVTGAELGLDLAQPTPPFRYYKFRDADDLKAAGVCQAGSGACSTGQAVYSPRYFHAHEQAHAYAYRAWSGWSTQLLDEGVAVALSCDPFRFLGTEQSPRDLVGGLDWRDRLELEAKDSPGYLAAGYFVTYLVTRYGWAPLHALHDRVPAHVSSEQFERAFAALYPISVDEAWTRALSVGMQPCLKDWMCAATPMGEHEVASLACDGQLHRSIVVTERARVGLTLQATNGALTLIRNCLEPAPTSLTLLGEGGSTTHWLELAPGTYTLSDPTGTGALTCVMLESNQPGTLLAPTCESAGAIALDPSGETDVHFSKDTTEGWFGIVGTEGRGYAVHTEGLASAFATASPVEICDGCGAHAHCAPPDRATAIGPDARVHVHAQSAAAKLGEGLGPYLSLLPTDPS
jgi:hypothetical protein